MNGAPVLETTKRKKDYVSFLALFLFALMLIFELIVIYHVELQSRLTDREKDVKIEETIEILDLLRANLIGTKAKFSQGTGEIEIAQPCLNDYAKYIRENKEKINYQQINEIYSKILRFEQIYHTWKARQTFSHELEFFSEKFIELQKEKLTNSKKE